MRYPLVYELNTRCWLHELSVRLGAVIDLADVPEDEFASWNRLGFTHVWAMGVWEAGPRTRAASLGDTALRQRCAEILPDFVEADLVGSPFAPASYEVASRLGGDAGLEKFRRRLHGHGLKLLLDFVPNHVGLDHPWVWEHPERFVHGAEPFAHGFARCTAIGDLWLAFGRDPYFPPWVDTVQLDYRRGDTRAAMIQVMMGLAARCDGLRCDMAMLLLNHVFARTWGEFPTIEPLSGTEFWATAIEAVRTAWPSCLLVAEAYWGLEPRLLELGFDYAYDKRLYDHLLARDRLSVHRHLIESPPQLVRSSVHFIENHDEPRIAGRVSLDEHRAATLLVLALPGMRLLHDGQLAGARSQVPVQLARRPPEQPDPGVQALYEQLLGAVAKSTVGNGKGTLPVVRCAGEGNPSWRNLVVLLWQGSSQGFDLAVVNLAPNRSQGFARIDVPGLERTNWVLQDRLGDERFERAGRELRTQGLFLDVGPYAAQLFHFRPVSTS